MSWQEAALISLILLGYAVAIAAVLFIVWLIVARAKRSSGNRERSRIN